MLDKGHFQFEQKILFICQHNEFRFRRFYAECIIIARSGVRYWHSDASRPGSAENIAHDGGSGSDIIVVRLQPLDNSWVQDE